jgi:hypothetical protein
MKGERNELGDARFVVRYEHEWLVRHVTLLDSDLKRLPDTRRIAPGVPESNAKTADLAAGRLRGWKGEDQRGWFASL